MCNSLFGRGDEFFTPLCSSFFLFSAPLFLQLRLMMYTQYCMHQRKAGKRNAIPLELHQIPGSPDPAAASWSRCLCWEYGLPAIVHPTLRQTAGHRKSSERSGYHPWPGTEIRLGAGTGPFQRRDPAPGHVYRKSSRRPRYRHPAPWAVSEPDHVRPLCPGLSGERL